MTATEDFVDSPIQFLTKNVLICPGGGIVSEKSHTKSTFRGDESTVLEEWIGGVQLFVLKEKTGWSATKQGIQVPVYGLYPATDTKDYFVAYWLPYRDNEFRGITVSKKADFMFTAEMSGCTLGIGMANKNGDTLVFHANLRQSGSKMQSTDQARLLELKLGGESTIFGPEKYRSSGDGKQNLNIRATNFGMRNSTSGKWTFLSHRYEMTGLGRCKWRGLGHVH